MTYGELKEQEQAGDYDQYWYQTRQGGKVSVCGSQLKRLEQDKIIDEFTIVAKHSDTQTLCGDYQEEEGFSPYTIPLGAQQQVRVCSGMYACVCVGRMLGNGL